MMIELNEENLKKAVEEVKTNDEWGYLEDIYDEAMLICNAIRDGGYTLVKEGSKDEDAG